MDSIQILTAPSDTAIVNRVNESWTLVDSGRAETGWQVACDKTPDPLAVNALRLVYVAGIIWYQNKQGLWRGKGRASDKWAPAAGTTISPLPISSSPSPDSATGSGSSGGTGSRVGTEQLAQHVVTASEQLAIAGAALSAAAAAIATSQAAISYGLAEALKAKADIPQLEPPPPLGTARLG